MKLFLLLILAFLSACSSKYTTIAHRGAPGYLPEHTLEGVRLAHSWNVDFIEPDIVITKDNQAVVLHDIHVDTTTDVAKLFPKRKRKDGRFYAVDFTLAEIKLLKVGERINLETGKKVYPIEIPYKRISYRVPTLIEFIEQVKALNQKTGKEIGIYPEIKSPEFHLKEKKDITKIVFNILEDHGYNKKNANIYVQCFYPPTLKRLRTEFKAKMPLIALIAENDWKESSIDYEQLKTDKGLKELSKYVDGIGPFILQLVKTKDGVNFTKSDLVEKAHKYGLKVHTYTHGVNYLPAFFNNDEKLFKFLYEEVKVDGVFSNFGDIALKNTP